MGRRLDFEKASHKYQAKSGLSVKDEAEWMKSDAPARWLRRDENRTSRKSGFAVSAQRSASCGMKLASPR